MKNGDLPINNGDLPEGIWDIQIWVCLKMLAKPLNPLVLLIIIPIKWLFHWEYTLFSDKPTSFTIRLLTSSIISDSSFGNMICSLSSNPEIWVKHVTPSLGWFHGTFTGNPYISWSKPCFPVKIVPRKPIVSLRSMVKLYYMSICDIVPTLW